jgi:hypothetical protein
MDTLRSSLSNDILAYQKDALSPWCNTVFIPHTFYNYRVATIPAGIGISYYLSFVPPHLPLKSKYMILNESFIEKFNNLGSLNVKKIKSLPLGELYFGDLYLNLNTRCTP